MDPTGSRAPRLGQVVGPRLQRPPHAAFLPTLLSPLPQSAVRNLRRCHDADKRATNRTAPGGAPPPRPAAIAVPGARGLRIAARPLGGRGSTCRRGKLPGWRNGRRRGLKIPFPQGSAGSTPAPGTCGVGPRHSPSGGPLIPRPRGSGTLNSGSPGRGGLCGAGAAADGGTCRPTSGASPIRSRNARDGGRSPCTD